MTDGRPATSYVRNVLLVEDGHTSDNSQKGGDVRFQVRSEPIPEGHFRSNPSVFLFELLNRWEWYEVPGTVIYRYDAKATGQDHVFFPCKLPDQWNKYLEQLMSLRSQMQRWFSGQPDADDLVAMKKELLAVNPLWRLCVARRLLELNKLKDEEVETLLKASAGNMLEFAPMIVFLLNDSTSHEKLITRMIKQERNAGLIGEGMALGCLTSAADKPRAIERAFESTQFLDKEKPGDPALGEDMEKTVNVLFPGPEAQEYRIAHKLNLLLNKTDHPESTRRIRGILSYMFVP